MNKSPQRQQGTYDLSSFQNQSDELVRLKRQASLLPQLELDSLKKHGLKPHMKVLDAACGPGLTASIIHDYLTTGHVTGVDLDASLLIEARRMAKQSRKAIRFRQADVYDLPFENEFDYIYCRFLFQHLEDPQRALASLSRALKPGGTLHILDVNDEWLFMYPEISEFRIFCQIAAEHQQRKGGNRFIGKALHHLFKHTGFEMIQPDVVTITSDMIGLETFLQITTRFKLEIIEPEWCETNP
ncbi:MAG: class I SAM-dependent methyltransferase, partial [Bacteroidota bacterium]